jgi:hypothetical protein
MQASLSLHPRERSCFILSTLKHLCHEPRFRHQWRRADHLASLCHKWFSIPKPLQFDGNDLNNALLKDPALKLDIEAEKSAPNQFGIYHDKYRPKDANTRAHCYYLCDPESKECVKSPPVGKPWFESVPQVFDDELQALGSATRNQENRQFPADVIDLVAKANALVQEPNKLENQRETKSRCLLDASNNCDSSSSCDFTETTGSDSGCHGGNNDRDGATGGNNDGDRAITRARTRTWARMMSY